MNGKMNEYSTNNCIYEKDINLSYFKYNTIFALWGGEKYGESNVEDDILYESNLVMIIKFKIPIGDPEFKEIENSLIHIPKVCKTEFEYIHKYEDDTYRYIGPIERARVLCVNDGIIEIEIVILKQDNVQDLDRYQPKYKSKSYPCKTKKDMCDLKGWCGTDILKKITIFRD